MIPEFKAFKMARETDYESRELYYKFLRKYGFDDWLTETMYHSAMLWLRKREEHDLPVAVMVGLNV